jgi:translocation and assembly module TamB
VSSKDDVRSGSGSPDASDPLGDLDAAEHRLSTFEDELLLVARAPQAPPSAEPDELEFPLSSARSRRPPAGDPPPPLDSGSGFSLRAPPAPESLDDYALPDRGPDSGGYSLRPPPGRHLASPDSGYSLRPPPSPDSGYSLRPPPSTDSGGYSLRPPPAPPAPPAPARERAAPAPRDPSKTASKRPPPRRRATDGRRDVGRILAAIVSTLFAILGLVPLLAALLVRTPAVQSWAAAEASVILRRELGAEATFRSRATLWPLAVTLSDVEVESSDGGAPFLTVEEATVRPRVFSLIAGKLDAGEVQVLGLRSRVVLEGGELVNFRPTLPESEGPSEELERAPLRSLSVTDAAVDLTIDGVRTKIAEIDVDLAFGEGLAATLAVHAARGTVTRVHADPAYADGRLAVDEDRLCRLDLRSTYDPATHLVTVRRLSLNVAVDLDPDPGTRPGCDLSDQDWRRLDVEVGALEVPLSIARGEGVGLLRGRVGLRAPIGVAHRFLKLPHATGAIDVELALERAPFEALPVVSGRVGAASVGIDGKIFTDAANMQVHLEGLKLTARSITARWGDGDFQIEQATIDLGDPKLPLLATDVRAEHVELQGLLRDLGAHPQSHVGWRLDEVSFESFGGTLAPVDLSGPITAATSDFGVFDRPSHKPDRQRMLSVDRGDVTGTLAIRPDAVYLEKMHLVTRGANVFTTVKLGFGGEFGLEVGRGSRVDLAELSPVVSVRMGGVTEVEAVGTGTFEMPRIEGDLSVDRFMIGGFEAGDVKKAHVVFLPLALDLTNVELQKNQSVALAPKMRVDFDGGADVLVDAEVDTRTPPSLGVRDFFQVFGFDQDPRFDGIDGVAAGVAKVHYSIGGPEDECGTGSLSVTATTEVLSPTMFGETFDRGSLAVDFRWDDSLAGADGMQIELPAIAVYDGPGSIVGEAHVKDGRIIGSMFGSSLTLDRLEGMGTLGKLLDGEASFLAKLSGSLARLSADLDVTLSPLRFGANRLPSSRLAIALRPDPTPPVVVGKTACGRPIGKPFDLTEYQRDVADGGFSISGQLFGGQIGIERVDVTKQKSKVVTGKVSFEDLDLGTIAAIDPALALENRVPNARLSADVDVTRLELENLPSADVSLALTSLTVAQGGRSVKLARAEGPLRLERGALKVPALDFVIADGRSDARIGFSLSGGVRAPFGPGEPQLDARLEMTPFNLEGLKQDLPKLDRIEGVASGGLSVTGSLSAPQVSGALTLRDGSVAIAGFPTSIEDIAVDVAIGDGEIRITKARASLGTGTVDVSGRVPIVGLSLGTGTGTVTGRNVKLPAGEGIDAVVDADLEITLPARVREEKALPDVRGKIEVLSFAYTRPISLAGYIGELTRSLGKAEAADYDPEGDLVTFNVLVDSEKPLKVENELAEVQLEFVDPGITLSGTNQRYGARGALRVLPESTLRLRNHEFDISEGFVRFDDPTKIRADIDVRAATEFRRYAQADASSTDGSSATAGQWDIAIHAYGTTDQLKLDLTSDPPLAREDIVLLLTVGMTRAEVDRGLASSLGETLGLEALTALTGADKAVKAVIPIIDYFHFGSTYSARTGRNEPTVTIGKRITDELRANVTTTLTQQDVAANVEWRLRKGVSVQATYDNINNIGTLIGNLGADLRWRLEFE